MGIREEQRAAGEAGYEAGRARGAAKSASHGQIGGTLAGAAAGAAIGSIIPGAGTLVGAGIGAMIGGAGGGLIGSIFGGKGEGRRASRRAKKQSAIAFNRRQKGVRAESDSFEAKGRTLQAKADTSAERRGRAVGGVASVNEVGGGPAPVTTVDSVLFDNWEARKYS